MPAADSSRNQEIFGGYWTAALGMVIIKNYYYIFEIISNNRTHEINKYNRLSSAHAMGHRKLFLTTVFHFQMVTRLNVKALSLQ